MDGIGIASCIGFFAVLAGWGLVCHGLAAGRSGWRRLSRRYPAGGRRAAGVRFGRATVRINARRYRDRVTVWVDGAGIRLAVPPPFRPFHPPIFVPWDDVVPTDVADPAAVGDEAVLRPGASAVTLTLSGPAARAAERALARRAASRRPRSRP